MRSSRSSAYFALTAGVFFLFRKPPLNKLAFLCFSEIFKEPTKIRLKQLNEAQMFTAYEHTHIERGRKGVRQREREREFSCSARHAIIIIGIALTN